MNTPYPHLLQPIQIGKFILKNRMQSSNSLPHFSQGPEKYPATATISHFLGRSRNGAGFITFAGFEDTVNAPPFPDTLDMSHFPEFDLRNAQCQNYMVELIEAMHGQNTLISGSLFSANRTYRYEDDHGNVEFVDANPRVSMDIGAAAMMSPTIGDDVPAENLVKIAKSFGQRTAVYKRLGFDAVTIHMSYRAQLPGQLLSPLTNHRTDAFGGSFENRVRFPLMMLEEIKKVAGNDMLIEIQFSGVEPDGGYTMEEGINFLRLAEPYVDIVQVRSSEGDPNHPIPFELKKMPFLELAAEIKKAGLSMLVSNVGGYFDPALADQAIADGKLDLVAMARAWISNPNYGELLLEDRAEDIVPCLRCNKCHGRGKRDLMTTVCSVNPKFGFEAVDRYIEASSSGISRTVAIIGGGPGGMRTAIYLADRGHSVTIYEAESQLGGAIKHADYVPFKWTLKDYKDYLIAQVNKRKIQIVLNTRATPQMIDGQYDVVIAAVGAQPVVPPIPGAGGDNVTIATDAIINSHKIGQHVLIIGGGEVGVETGMFLAQQGKDVTVIEMRGELAADTTLMHYRSMFQAAWEAIPNFHYVLNARAKAITSNSVSYEDQSQILHTIPADSVVLSVGMRAKSAEALSFYGTAKRFYMVGDCKQPGTIQTTNRSAYCVANQI